MKANSKESTLLHPSFPSSHENPSWQAAQQRPKHFYFLAKTLVSLLAIFQVISQDCHAWYAEHCSVSMSQQSLFLFKSGMITTVKKLKSCHTTQDSIGFTSQRFFTLIVQGMEMPITVAPFSLQVTSPTSVGVGILSLMTLALGHHIYVNHRVLSQQLLLGLFSQIYLYSIRIWPSAE